MNTVAYGVPWIPASLLESFLTTKWKILEYTGKKLSFDEIAKEKPTVLISFSPPEEIRSLESVKWLLTPGAGIDNMPLDKIAKQEQKIINCHANSTSVAEHAWALLLATARKITKYDSIVREQQSWPNRNQISDLNYDLSGKTLGLIGFGAIGKQLYNYGRIFGMEVMVFRKNPEEKQFQISLLEQHLEDLDILIIACPLTKETRGLISTDLIRKLPSHAIVVNIARGEIIDEEALFDALKEGEIRGAGIDTWNNSPYRGGDGVDPVEIVTIPNLVISPHRAWVSKESYGEIAQALANELDLIFRNKKSNNEVDPNLQY